MWKSRRDRIIEAIGTESRSPREIHKIVNTNVRWWQRMSLFGVFDLLEDLEMHGYIHSRWDDRPRQDERRGPPRRIYWQQG